MEYEVEGGRFLDHGEEVRLWYQQVQACREYCTFPEEGPEGFTVASLAAGETQLLQGLRGRERDYPRYLGGANEDVIWLGEVLLSITGGQWNWHQGKEGRGEPVIVPDPALRIAGISPRALINHAVRTASGQMFQEVSARLGEAVAQYRGLHPSWEPRLIPLPDWADNPRLHTWLADRREGFPSWAQSTGEAASWDFSAASLDRLQEIFLNLFRTRGEVDEQKGDPFLEGCVWYLGEVQCRNDSWAWNMSPHPLAEGGDDPYVTEPDQDEEDEEEYEGGPRVLAPLAALRTLITSAPGTSLRDLL
ncbi:hypothetical protein ACIRPT_04730 [Streptomyces sp. NPDC101227]|uniref:hypothetical protein n=1 Tax=Streptomyces sp. NPDC101227 TaxID=3366136 RepID=UPI00382016CA